MDSRSPPEGVGLDRRTHPRYAVSCPVNLSVEVLGAQFVVECFSSSGAVLDISRSGLRAEVDRLVAVGTGCSLSLIDAEGLVCPQQIRGRVCRASIAAAGWCVGVSFDDLVDVRPRAVDGSSMTEVRTA